MVTPFFSPNIGGVETHLDDLCRYLLKRGHKISVITYQPLTIRRKGQSVEVKGDLITRRIDWFGCGWFNKLEPYPLLEIIYLFPALCLYTFLFVLFNRRRFDVIVTHGLIASLVGKFIKLTFKKCMIATVHTIYYLNTKPLLGRIFAWVLKSYDKILFVSEKIRREFRHFGIESNRTVVFTYWADHTRFKPLDKDQVKKMLGLDGKFIVLFVGRLIREKGADVLVKAARMTDKNILYAFITSGSYDEFRRVVKGNIPSNVIYVGPIEYSKLHLYYNAADVFALPSVQEGQGIALLEAQATAKPVVAFDVGGVREAILDKETGLLLKPDSHELAKAILKLLADRPLREKMGRKGREFVSKNFSWDACAQRMLQIYREAAVT